MNSSRMKTTRQHMTETGNNPRPAHDAMIPRINANAPATGEEVASIIAGNVITASVT